MDRVRKVAARGVLAAAAVIGLAAAPAAFAQSPDVTLTLKDHRFTPAVVQVPANQRVRITLINKDMAAEEFDSHDLRVEQVVTPNATISFTIGPLQPGQYSFMGEFHAATAQGHVIAR